MRKYKKYNHCLSPTTSPNLHPSLYIYEDLYLDLYLKNHNLGILKVFTSEDTLERHLNRGSRCHQRAQSWVAGVLSPELVIMHLCAQLIRRHSSEYKLWKVYPSRNRIPTFRELKIEVGKQLPHVREIITYNRR